MSENAIVLPKQPNPAPQKLKARPRYRTEHGTDRVKYGVRNYSGDETQLVFLTKGEETTETVSTGPSSVSAGGQRRWAKTAGGERQTTRGARRTDGRIPGPN